MGKFCFFLILFKPFYDRLHPSWILVLRLAELRSSECYSVIGRNYDFYQFESGVTGKWGNEGQ